MKRVVSLLIIVLFIVGCKKQEDFYLNYKNKDLYLNREFSEQDYGAYNNLFESENCAFGDKDITYIYDDIEVEAYGNEKGKMIVYSIVLTGENVKTNEKIGLYDTMSDAIKVYGENYIRNGNTYLYIHNNTEIVFVTQNDIIEKIEYRLINFN